MKIKKNHQAFILLKNCFALSLQYAHPAYPAYYHMEDLERLDETLVAALAAITNIRFGENILAQVTLPVCLRELSQDD